MTKICSKCKTEYPATTEYFYLNRNNKDGMHRWCKSCKVKSQKQYCEANKEKISKQKHEYREINKEIILEYVQKYYKDNKEKLSEYNRKYREGNKYILAEHFKQWVKNNPEKIIIFNQRRRSRKRELLATLTAEQWESIKATFGNKCCYCGQEKPLAQEHFIPISKGGEYATSNILPACKNCNSSKRNTLFEIWFPKQSFYSKTREKRILRFLNYHGDIQQLSM